MVFLFPELHTKKEHHATRRNCHSTFPANDADSHSEVIYAITMESVLSAIVQRLGEKELNLSVDDLHLARDEVKITISHNLDERDYIVMGLDS